ncbi:hypothetical protein [Propionimicrobium sp. PCR01-08-3]|uniref:PspA-associated protein PspAA n=1 Tax=Propionimicrobium sp. PCR01-08-3 TaxID=3052086 RepID=UPI00255CA4E5|nr:hypothetical protein [Propionimicrobium sp. PCR01-08-3]WIY81688.1 hypothetical protein QQ658_09135 [Propionimicrobium sp. PCR01-08-3]
MIVRILGSGQWEVPAQVVPRLNVIDDLVMTAVHDRDADYLAELLQEMADLIKQTGTPVPSGPVVLSDQIIPSPSTPIGEVADWLQESRAEDGLIPGQARRR